MCPPNPCRPRYAATICSSPANGYSSFSSRTVLLGVAFFAGVLLVTSLAFSFFPGWVLAILIGIYVVVAMIKRRSNPVF